MSNELFDAYLFDLDGTLVDTAGDLTNSLNFVLQKFENVTVESDRARDWVGGGAKTMIQQALESLNQRRPSDSELDEMHKHFLAHYEENLAVDSRPYPTVVDTLEQLHSRNILMGVVTNKWYDLAFRLLVELDLYKFMQVVVGGDSLQVNKPAAEPALYACNELNVEPAKTMFVGDSISDVGCARAAGCPVVVMEYGYSGDIVPSCLGADRVVKSFAELL